MLIRDMASALPAFNRKVILAQFPTLIAFWEDDSTKTRGPSPPPLRCIEKDTILAVAKNFGFAPRGPMLERELVAWISVPGGNWRSKSMLKNSDSVTTLIKKLSIRFNMLQASY